MVNKLNSESLQMSFLGLFATLLNISPKMKSQAETKPNFGDHLKQKDPCLCNYYYDFIQVFKNKKIIVHEKLCTQLLKCISNIYFVP